MKLTFEQQKVFERALALAQQYEKKLGLGDSESIEI
jgi:hypothetical protein